MKYKSGYKYQLCENYSCQTRIKGYFVKSEYIDLGIEGTLTIKNGYAWDGTSGPTLDDKTNMRGSLEHDVKYQLIRLGRIPEASKDIADQEFKERCIEDGMNRFRAWYYFKGVHLFGSFSCKSGTEQTVKEVP